MSAGAPVSQPLSLLVVAGEVSGDHHLTAAVDALSGLAPGLRLFGVGGDGLASRGADLVAHQRDLAVIGIVEAIGKVRFARRLIRRLVDEALARRVDGAVLVDSPDFNLPLAKRLARAGIPVVFYVSPQVWAWRSGRARTIARVGRGVLVLFGFEKRWWDARGLGGGVRWVGHPLVDAAARELSEPAPRTPGRRTLALMPGSRSGEIARNLPAMRDAAETLRRERPELDVVLVKADSVSEAQLRAVVGDALDAWTVVEGPHLARLAAADALVVASGTATVEGLLTGVPMVVVYRLNPVSHFLGRRLVKVPFIAMANLVTSDGSGTPAVPELIQRDVTPERIAREVRRYLDDPARAAATRERLLAGARDLGPAGAPGRTARAILACLGRSVPGDAELRA